MTQATYSTGSATRYFRNWQWVASISLCSSLSSAKHAMVHANGTTRSTVLSEYCQSGTTTSCLWAGWQRTVPPRMILSNTWMACSSARTTTTTTCGWTTAAHCHTAADSGIQLVASSGWTLIAIIPFSGKVCLDGQVATWSRAVCGWCVSSGQSSTLQSPDEAKHSALTSYFVDVTCWPGEQFSRWTVLSLIETRTNASLSYLINVTSPYLNRTVNVYYDTQNFLLRLSSNLSVQTK